MVPTKRVIVGDTHQVTDARQLTELRTLPLQPCESAFGRPKVHLGTVQG